MEFSPAHYDVNIASSGADRATTLQAERSGFRIPVHKEIFLFSKSPDLLWAPPSILLTGYRNSFPGIKRPGREVNHSPPSSFAVTNGWNRASVPQLCVHAVERDNFFFSIPFGNKNRVFWFSGNALGL